MHTLGGKAVLATVKNIDALSTVAGYQLTLQLSPAAQLKVRAAAGLPIGPDSRLALTSVRIYEKILFHKNVGKILLMAIIDAVK